MHKFKAAFQDAYDAITQAGYTPPYSDFLLRKVDDEFQGYLHDRPVGSGLYYALFAEFIRRAEVKTVVELGNREGAGILAMYTGMKANTNHDNIHLYTIDTVRNLRFVPKEVLEDRNVYYIFGDVLKPSVYRLFSDKKIDMLFCDTIHTRKQLQSEWAIYKQYLSEEAIVFVDDILLADKKKAFDAIGQESLEDTRLHSSGFGIAFYEKEKDVNSKHYFWDALHIRLRK